jgi:predicted type IV restriction endonuclease
MALQGKSESDSFGMPLPNPLPMASIPKRVEERLIAGLKKFQPVLAQAKSKDVNESDTVVILNDLLGEVFGYAKYFEITSEFAIRGTYCDLAIKVDGKLTVLLEAKAIGHELRDNHVKQAVDYAANQGVEWVVLTNAAHWRIYKVIFGKPIEHEVVCEFDFLTLDPKDDTHLQFLYLLTKEGWAKSAVTEFNEQKQALSSFYVAAVLLSEPVLNTVRRELKRVSPDVKIEADQIRTVLMQEVIKRDVLDGEKFASAQKALAKAAGKALRQRKECENAEAGDEPTTESLTPLPPAPAN